MKKLLSIVLAFTMVICVLVAATSCEEGYFDFLFQETTPVDTSADINSTTEFTTAATTTEVTTTATTENPNKAAVLELLADFDFNDGKVVDKLGHVTTKIVGTPVISKTGVNYGEKYYKADALITGSGSYVVCQFNDYTTSASFKAFAQKSFSIEAFYTCGPAGNVQGIVCGTQDGGWGLAQKKTENIPYFIVGSGASKNTYKSVYASQALTAELTHVVAVYDYENLKLYIYVNGTKVNEADAASDFFCGVSDTFNRFCLGDDIKVNNIGGDFPTTGGMTMVDAKIYAGVMDEDTIKNSMNATVATFEESVDPTLLPSAYVDINFANGAVTDAKGKVSFKTVGTPTIAEATVGHASSTTSLAALKTDTKNYVVCEFNDYKTSAEFKAFAEKGFTIEAFYQMGKGSAVQGIVCGTEAGGWGLAARATGVPYFIVGTGASKNTYKNVDAASAASTTELTHVVAVYDYESKLLVIYVNGAKAGQAALAPDFFCGAGDTFNRFCLGSDIKANNVGGDFPTTGGMTLVDAKIYASALSGEQAALVYAKAAESFK